MLILVRGPLVKGLVMPWGAEENLDVSRASIRSPACAAGVKLCFPFVCVGLSSKSNVLTARQALASPPPVSESYREASCKRALQEGPRGCVARTGHTAMCASC